MDDNDVLVTLIFWVTTMFWLTQNISITLKILENVAKEKVTYHR